MNAKRAVVGCVIRVERQWELEFEELVSLAPIDVAIESKKA